MGIRQSVRLAPASCAIDTVHEWDLLKRIQGKLRGGLCFTMKGELRKHCSFDLGLN